MVPNVSFRKIFPPATSKSAVSTSRATSALSQKRLEESRARRAQIELARNTVTPNAQQQQATAIEVGETHAVRSHTQAASAEMGSGEISD